MIKSTAVSLPEKQAKEQKSDKSYTGLFERVVQLIQEPLKYDEPVDIFLLAAQLIAWVRNSQSGLLQAHDSLKFREDLILSGKELADRLQQVVAETTLHEISLAFQPVGNLLEKITRGDLTRVFDLFNSEIPLGTLAEPCALTVFMGKLAKSSQNRRTVSRMPDSLFTLMVELAGIKSGEMIGVVYETTFQLTAQLLEYIHKDPAKKLQYTIGIFPGNENRLNILGLMRLLCDPPAPTFNGKEDMEDMEDMQRCIGFIPIGISYLPSTMNFEHPGNSSAARYVEEVCKEALAKIFEHTHTGGVICVPTKYLSSSMSKEERALWLQDNRIRAVIRLPDEGILRLRTNISLSLLVLGKKPAEGNQNEIFFIDTTQIEENDLWKEEIFQDSEDNSRRVIINNVLKILDSNSQSIDWPEKVQARQVTLNEIIDRGKMSLDASWYIRQKQTTNNNSSDNGEKSLGEVVDFVRTLSTDVTIYKDNTPLEIVEIGPSAFPEFGFLDLQQIRENVRKISEDENKTAPEANITVEWQDKKDRVLEKYDILMIIKGRTNIGNVAMFPASKDEELKNNRVWVAAQSCLVLRVKNNNEKPLDARVLLSILQSTTGRHLIRQNMITTSSVPLIRIPDLKKIPIPDRSEAEVGDIFNELFEYDIRFNNGRQLQRQAIDHMNKIVMKKEAEDEPYRMTMEQEKNILLFHLPEDKPEESWLLSTGTPFSLSWSTRHLLINGKMITTHGISTLNKEVLEAPNNFLKEANKEIVGILGTDVFLEQDVLFDVKNHQATFYQRTGIGSLPKNKMDNWASVNIEIMYLFGMYYPVITLNLNGESCKAFLETAAPVSYVHSSLVTGRNSIGKTMDFYPGIGEFEVKLYELPLHLKTNNNKGTIDLGTLQVGVLPEELQKTVLNDSIVAILGNSFMNTRNVLVSLGNKCLKLER